jgi:hypothetical protein
VCDQLAVCPRRRHRGTQYQVAHQTAVFSGCSRSKSPAGVTNKPTITQRRELDRLEGQLERLRIVLEDILQLAEEIKQGTIERVLAKSDLELGLEALLRMTNGR